MNHMTITDTSSSRSDKPLKKRSPVMVACKPTWQNMLVYQTITNTTCPNINAELLLVSRPEFITWIVLCPMVVVVKIYDAVSTKTCLI
jgi:hypothetical protein